MNSKVRLAINILGILFLGLLALSYCNKYELHNFGPDGSFLARINRSSGETHAFYADSGGWVRIGETDLVTVAKEKNN